MANKEAIYELVDEKAFKEIERLVSTLGLAKNEMGELISLAIKFNNTLGGSKSLKEFDTNSQKFIVTLNKIPSVQDKIRQSELKLQQTREKAMDKYFADLQKQDVASSKQVAKTFELERAYAKANKELNIARGLAKDIGITYGITSKEFAKASKEVDILDKRLKSVDKALGQNQRFVGEYERGNRGFSNSIAQIAREAPAFAYSIQTGISALSNQFGALIDDYKALAEQNRQLVSNGQKPVSIFKQLASSILSFNTLISIAVTLAVLYGKEIGEFVTAIFKGKDAVDAFTLRQKTLNEAFKSTDISSAVKNINELKINIDLAKNGFLDKEKVLKQYNNTIGQTTGEVKNLDEAEKQLTQNGDAYIKMMLYKAAANLALEDAAKKSLEAEQTRLKKVSDFSKTAVDTRVTGFGSTSFNAREYEADRQRVLRAQQKRKDDAVKISTDAADQQLNIAKKFQLDAAKIAKDNKFNFFPDEDIAKSSNSRGINDKKDSAKEEALMLQKIKLEGQRDTQSRILESEKATLGARLDAQAEYVEKSKKIAEIDKDIKLTQDDLTANGRKIIEAEYQNQRSEITYNGEKQRVKILTDGEKELAKILKDGVELTTREEQEKIIATQEAGQDRLRQIERIKSDELAILAEKYSSGIIGETQYHQELYDIEAKSSQDRIQTQISALKNEIEIDKEYLRFGLGSIKDLAADEKKLTDLEIEASNLKTKVKIDNAEKVKKALDELHQKEKELAYAIAEIGIAAVNSSFQNKQDKLQKEDEEATEKAELERTRIEESLLSEDEKKIKLAQLDDRERSRKESLESRQRELEVRQAKFEKAISIGKIIANTAVAASKAGFLTPLGLVISALGAAQVAQVIATKIPAFEDGGTKQGDGLARYSEGGKQELMITPDGSLRLTPPKETISHVKHGTQFISNRELMQIVGKPEQINYVGGSQISMDEVIRAVRESGKETSRAISKIPPSTQITKSGWRKTQNKINGWTQYLNDRIN